MWTESYRLNRGLGKQEVRERKRRKGPPLLIWAKLQSFSPRAAEGEGKPAALPGYQDGSTRWFREVPVPHPLVSGRVWRGQPATWSSGGNPTPAPVPTPPRLARKEWLLPQGSSTASHLLLSPWYLPPSPSLVTPGDISVCYWTKDKKNKEFKAPQRVLI